MIEEIIAQFDLGQSLTVGLILFSATVVVRVSGFGGSLVAIPLIAPIIGLSAAPPLMNLFGVTNFSTVIVQRWRDLTFKDVWRLSLMNVLITPFGIWTLNFVTEDFLRTTLGIVCIVYAGLRMFNVPAPKLARPFWQWVYGFISGIFTGTFGVGGVPAVLYADTQSWEAERFRLNLFTFFFITGYVNLISRFIAGQYTPTIVVLWLTTIPFLFAGLWVGERLSRIVKQEQFSYLVLFLLIVLGGRLIYSVFG